MSDAERTPLDDPQLLPFLPMLYVAWADGELDPDEIRAIRDDLDECAECLDSWLDPGAPPTERQLGRMLRLLRRGAADVGTAEKLDLVGFGRRLAQAYREDDRPISQAEQDALQRIADQLGIAGTEAARQLLASRRRAERAPEAPPSFDVAALSERLAGDWPEVRQRVFELLREPEFRFRAGLDAESYREQVLAWCERLAGEGLGGLSYPESSGGAGDLGAFITAFESLAFHDLSLLVKFGVQFGLFGGAIMNLGTETHHREYLPRVASLELPGCFAMTETGHGSNVADLETTATWDQDAGEFVLDTPSRSAARKDYIGNAARDGRMAVVFAQLRVGEEEHGVHAFVVPIRDAAGVPERGVSITDCGHKMGLNGVDNGRLHFDGVRVPRRALLDRFASVSEDGIYESPISSPSKRFFTMLGTLVGGRVSVALAANSASKSALAIAVRYAAKRRQFGPGGEQELRLLDYPSHRRKLLPRVVTSYALTFALDQLRRDYVAAMAPDGTADDDSGRRRVEQDAAGLKAFATYHATDTIQACREACGGQGYLSENRFAALKADTDVFMTFEGDNTVLLLLVAKGMLTELRDRFRSMGIAGFARWIAARAEHESVRLKPWQTRRTSHEHLQDRDFHLAAFRWREDDLQTEVASRMRSLIKDGADPTDAMLDVQNDLLAMASARVERQILERFVAAVEATDDEAQRQILADSCHLFALSRLEVDRAYFLEHGYFGGGKSRAVSDEVDRLCQALRPQARHLVEAFGIPPSLLSAPIAR